MAGWIRTEHRTVAVITLAGRSWPNWDSRVIGRLSSESVAS